MGTKKTLGRALRQSPNARAAHQLAAGPIEYFRVESPFSAAPSLDPRCLGPETCLQRCDRSHGEVGEEKGDCIGGTWSCEIHEVGMKMMNDGNPGLDD